MLQFDENPLCSIFIICFDMQKMAISYNIFLYNSKCTVPVFEMVPKKSDSRFFLNFANILKMVYISFG